MVVSLSHFRLCLLPSRVSYEYFPLAPRLGIDTNPVLSSSGELPVPSQQGVRGGPRQQEPLPVLPATEVFEARDES